MPNRFSPGVLPTRKAGLEDLADSGIDAFFAAREIRQRETEARAREERAGREDARAEETQSNAREDRAMVQEEFMRARGFEPTLDVEPPDTTPRDLGTPQNPFEGTSLGMGGTTTRAPDPSQPRGLFDRRGAAEGRPAILPGQFVPGVGFSDRAVFEPRPERQSVPRDTETVGGRSFSKVRDPEAEARARAQAQFDNLGALGVPGPAAALAADDEVLRRELITDALAEPDPEVAASDLVDLGLDPDDAAAIAALARSDPTLARQIAGDAFDELREKPFDEQLSEAERMSEARARGTRRGAPPVNARDRLSPEDQRAFDQAEERRREIMLAARVPVTDAWQQDIVDQLSGFDAAGNPQAPMSLEEVRAGWRGASSAESFRQIEQFLNLLAPAIRSGGGGGRRNPIGGGGSR
jgi:hypothetical protein